MISLFFVSFIHLGVEEVVVGIFLHMQFAHFLVEHRAKFVDVDVLAGGDEDAVVVEFRHPCAAQLIEGDVLFCRWGEVVGLFLGPVVCVDFVEHYHCGFVAAPQFAEGLLHH